MTGTCQLGMWLVYRACNRRRENAMKRCWDFGFAKCKATAGSLSRLKSALLKSIGIFFLQFQDVSSSQAYLYFIAATLIAAMPSSIAQQRREIDAQLVEERYANAVSIYLSRDRIRGANLVCEQSRAPTAQDAITALNKILESDQPTNLNDEAGRRLLSCFARFATELPNEALVKLAMLYASTNASVTYAARLLEIAAEHGSVDAMYFMGWAYPAITPEKKMRWLVVAAEREHPGAQLRLGNYFGTTSQPLPGYPRDINQGLYWLKKALVNPNSQRSDKVNCSWGTHFYRTRLSNGLCIVNLAIIKGTIGQLYIAASNASPDYAAGAKWITEAVEDGYGLLALDLARLYEEGLGVERNIGHAERLRAIYRQAVSEIIVTP